MAGEDGNGHAQVPGGLRPHGLRHDGNTLPVSSLGPHIDDTAYHHGGLYLRAHRVCRQGLRHARDRTLEEVFDEPVRAILRNMVVISIGFVPLFFSRLVPYQTVGFFFAAIMAFSGMATLVGMPALMS